MLAVFERTGLPISRWREGNIIHVTLSLRSEQGPEPKRWAGAMWAIGAATGAGPTQRLAKKLGTVGE